MWNISKETKEKHAKCNLLPIHESDEDWQIAIREAKEEGEDLIQRLKGELAEAEGELTKILPSKFIPYLENGTLNQPELPKKVREDYLQWMHEADKEFEKALEAAFEQTKFAVGYLPDAVQDVFAESLHDATIERIERTGDTLYLYINTDGGFSSKAFIHLTFHNVVEEVTDEPIQIGQWLIYYEMQKKDNGFAFRVLFDCPDAEWTITMQDIDAAYYYRPAAYVLLSNEGKLEETSLADYINQLNPAFRYWLITPDVICSIQAFSNNIILEDGRLELGPNEVTITVGNKSYIYDLETYNPIKFIYTDVYEDPYAHFEEPVPAVELETAALSDDLTLQVRAWNTMYANFQELADIINRILLKMDITPENEMMVSVYASHFYEKGILSEAVIEKYRSLL